ncbi:TRAP transporter small permease subunit [Marivibrio halodurans]|uniref:TRAP transporter small permease protein n=1 Tax=Marivibrio halodurans TaxID=2039722 RepID=A0A8J7S5G7_9PROT|nr:TRAP transporter small permease subunit [Marivibrio halodurans]MBP5855937.1 TRAP transporter small permease subunit [Marivibrio halodurans]
MRHRAPSPSTAPRDMGPAALVSGLADAIDRVNRSIGAVVGWCALMLVLVQAGIVLMRYIFGAGSVFAQEAVLYLHGTLLLLGAAYTLSRDGHVRLDLFHRNFGPRGRALVDLIGTAVLLIPVALVIWSTGWGYVASAWQSLEGSPEVSGIPARFLLKSAILGFAGLLLLQAVASLLRAGLVLARPSRHGTAREGK